MPPTRAILLLAFFSLSLSFRLDTNCNSTNAFYDSTILDCSSCPGNQVVNATNGMSCQCAPGLAKTPATKDFANFQCEACSSGVPSSDQYSCQLCPGDISQATKECKCATLEAIVEKSSDGAYLNRKECVLCSDKAYQGPGTYNCEVCPSVGMNRTASNNYACECDTGQNYTPAGPICVLSSAVSVLEGQYPITKARTVEYTSYESLTGTGPYSLSGSDTFSYYYYKSADGCQNHNSVKDCQALANLCVLQLYNGATYVCQYYKSLVKEIPTLANLTNPDPGWKKGMPWLYYMNPTQDVLDRKAGMTVSFDVSATDKVGLLDFRLAKYHMDGTFLGFEKLTDQFILCPHSSEDTERYRRFGTNVQIACSIDVSLFVEMTDTYFYELFLMDDNGEMLDIPIRIKNYVDENGISANKETIEANWKFVRRFYIYDNISGRVGTDAYISKAKPQILQYLTSAVLTVNLQTNDNEKIHIPYVTLEYRARLVSYIKSQDSTADVSFESEYVMDIGNFLQVAMGILILAHVITLFVCIVRTYVWTKNNPPAISRETYVFWLCGKSCMIFLGTWTFIIFWYIFLLSAYWFIFFKMQYHVFVLLPSAYDPRSYVPFAAIVGLLTFLHLISVFDLIRRQAKTDFFFIDWETPNRVLKPGTDQLKAIADEVRGEPPKSDYYKLSVSAWRSIFVANELNELQIQRYISLEFTLLFTVFFLE